MPETKCWMEARLTGAEGELKAIKYLEERGFKVLKRTPRAPYDLIATRGGRHSEHYVIEVKTGSSGIDVNKIERIIKTRKGIPALLFVKLNPKFSKMVEVANYG